jgi:hypothetical protein
MQIRMIAVCCLLSAGSLTAIAQMGADAAKGPAAGTVISPATALDSELSLIEGEMMGAVKAMPEEKFGFAPSAAIFVPGQATEFATVRTFAQQATHVAQANYFLFGMMSGLKPDVDVKAIGSMTKKDDVVAALAGGIQTRSTFAGFTIGHCNDHYGQMIEYLRMNGIVPPASAK